MQMHVPRIANDASPPHAMGKRFNSLRVWLAALLIIGLASCERVPSKSDYVSARVTELCAGESGDALRACRLAVINQFKDTPLEELKSRFPKPEPRARPSCGA